MGWVGGMIFHKIWRATCGGKDSAAEGEREDCTRHPAPP